MLNINKEATADGGVVLKLAGDATIEHAEQLHKAILDELQKVEHLLIDSELVDKCDFYTMQMFCSAHRTAVKWNKQLTFHGVPSAVVEETIRATGFARSHPCSFSTNETDDCMWVKKRHSSAN